MMEVTRVAMVMIQMRCEFGFLVVSHVVEVEGCIVPIMVLLSILYTETFASTYLFNCCVTSARSRSKNWLIQLPISMFSWLPRRYSEPRP